MPKAIAKLAILLLWAAPLFLGLVFSLLPIFDSSSWLALFAHPQLFKSLTLSIVTGTAALAGSLLLALAIVAGLYDTPRWASLSRSNGLFLAVPHLAFAIGLAFVLMPTGLIARVIAQLATGWTEPPAWVMTQDPTGLALILALICKETPFLVWAAASLLSRGDMALAFRGQWRSARSLGHGPRSIWLRLLLPQILQAMVWPIIIVWAYGTTVVDVALAIGPTQPSTFSVIALTDLNDVEPSVNARGAAGALLLAIVTAAVVLLGYVTVRLTRPWLRRFATQGPARAEASRFANAAPVLLLGLKLIYLTVAIILVVMSAGSQWPFPDWLPQSLQWRSWGTLLHSPSPLLHSLWLAALTSATATVLAVLWFETIAQQFDRWIAAAAITALAIPQITIVSGQYALFSRLGLTGNAGGLFVAHFTPVFAYVAVVLLGPYRAFDRRFKAVSLGLNCSPWRFWLSVKAPMTLPSLAAAAAVGFAVSLVQYLPAQLIGSGRFVTLPIEAVTLTSGGNRPLLAVYALALTLPAAAGFFIAHRLARPSWSKG